MKKSARVSEKLVSPGLPGLQVATRLLCLVNSESLSDIKGKGSDHVTFYSGFSPNKKLWIVKKQQHAIATFRFDYEYDQIPDRIIFELNIAAVLFTVRVAEDLVVRSTAS